jgi:hypothetical protein
LKIRRYPSFRSPRKKNDVQTWFKIKVSYCFSFFFQIEMENSKSRQESEHPTKEPFSSADESSSTGGSSHLFKLVAAPFAAVGGLIDQVSRKVTRATEEEPTPSSTPTTKE